MKTWVPKGSDKSLWDRDWFVIDADGVSLGRLSTRVANILRGKHKPVYTPFMDMGDHVVVINANKIKLTGRKLDSKVYYNHSLYPGGMKSETAAERMSKQPEKLVSSAVRGMLPKNRLGRKMIKKLKVYAGPDHPHQAQKPKVVSVTELR